MAQRLMVARSICTGPPAVWTSRRPASTPEPAGALDILRRLKRRGQTILLTTHYMKSRPARDRVAVMDHGRILALGTPGELKQSIGATPS